MKRRHISSRRTIATTATAPPAPAAAVGQPGDQRIVGDEFAHPRLELAAANPADPKPERLDRVPDRVLDVEELALKIAPLGEQKPQPIALLACGPVRHFPPGRDSRGLRHKHLRPPMIARAPRTAGAPSPARSRAWTPKSAPENSIASRAAACVQSNGVSASASRYRNSLFV